MSYCECDCFERKLAYHTAPALLGIKSACLFSSDEVSSKEICQFNSKASCKNLKIKVLCRLKKRWLIMLYNESKLTAQLYSPENIILLEQYGYNAMMSVEDMLSRLAKRIEESENFPHEIGVFLGYPAEDVAGFIRYGGENYKLCGYWKVYGDVEKAKHTFTNYNKCRDFLCRRLSQGADIYQALKIS